MRTLRQWLVLALAISSLVLATGCADDSSSSDTDIGSGGETASGGTTGQGGEAGGEAGAGGEGGGEIGAGGDAGGEAGSTGEGGSSVAMVSCDEDTIALPDTAAGEYAPASRVSSVSLPADKDAADAAGCATRGALNGSGLTGLLGLLMIDSLDEYFAADAEDPIHLLAHMSGWEAGQIGGEVSEPILKMYLGEMSGEDMYISTDSLNEAGDALIQFPADINGCLVTTEKGPFSFSLPVQGLVVNLNLEQTQIAGKVSVSDNGINMTDTNISGYLTRAAIVDLIGSISELCMSDDAPSFCDDVGTFLAGDPEVLVDTLAAFVGGFDSGVDDAGVVADSCAGADCNAVSVCLNIASEAATIAGVAAAVESGPEPAPAPEEGDDSE